METFETIAKILTPVIMGLLVIAKLWLELKKTEAERDATIKGVEKHAKDNPYTGSKLKDEIANAAFDAGVAKRLKKTVEKVTNEG